MEGLNEDTSSPVFWSTTQIDSVITEAQEVLAEELALVKRSALTPLRQGRNYYFTEAIASDIMVPYRVWLVGDQRRLDVVTIQQLDERHETWITVSGDPWHWFPVSWDMFGIFPHASTDGGILRVDYIAYPRTLLDDNDEPEMSAPEQDAMVLYGIYDGFLKQWDVERAMTAFALFLQRIPMGQGRANVELQAARMERSFDRRPFRTGVSI